MVKFLWNFVAEEAGATAIEYGLSTSLIAVFLIGFLIGALSALGMSLSNAFAEVSGVLK